MPRLHPSIPWLVLAGFLILLLLSRITFVQNQWQMDLANARKAAMRELNLLATLVQHDLQLGNYQHISELLRQWGDNNSDIAMMRLIAANGYVISEYVRPERTAHPLPLETVINYSYSGEARLQLTMGLDQVYQRRAEFAWRASMPYIMVTILLTALTYALIRYQRESAILKQEVKLRHEAESALQQQRDQLEEIVAARTSQLAAANKELEAFSYSVSHDLRAPLRAIDGFAQALDEDYGSALDQSGRDYLARIRAGAQRMGLLIDDLLRLARVSRAEVRPTTIDLSAMAADIISQIRATTPQRRVQIEIAPNLTAQGDAQLLHVALNNLLDNAWKYTSRTDAARIEVGCRSVDGKPVFYVRDNGAGFDMQYVEKLFGPFQRLHRPEEYAGTGIGLATVARIIHRHNGKIWAEGIPDRGATFYFTLE